MHQVKEVGTVSTLPPAVFAINQVAADWDLNTLPEVFTAILKLNRSSQAGEARLQAFICSAMRNTGRTAEQIRKGVALLQEPLHQYSCDEFFDALVEAEVFPSQLKNEVSDQAIEWLREPVNLLACISYLPAQEIKWAPHILHYTLYGKDVELAKAMLNDATGIDLKVNELDQEKGLGVWFHLCSAMEDSLYPTESEQKEIIEVLKLLVNKNFDINVSQSQDNQTRVLHAMVRSNYPTWMIAFVLDNLNADINVAVESKTALYYAVDLGSVEIVRLLLNKGAGLNIYNEKDGTLLKQAKSTFEVTLGEAKTLLEEALKEASEDHGFKTAVELAYVKIKTSYDALIKLKKEYIDQLKQVNFEFETLLKRAKTFLENAKFKVKVDSQTEVGSLQRAYAEMDVKNIYDEIRSYAEVIELIEKHSARAVEGIYQKLLDIISLPFQLAARFIRQIHQLLVQIFGQFSALSGIEVV